MMRPIILLFIAIVFFPVLTASADDFIPETLTLSAESMVPYTFDGSTLEIPVTVEGNGASAVFLVFTNDMGNSISKVRNGYLGWHYVDGIDTCIYNAAPVNLQSGDNVMSWNGLDNDGNSVPGGIYTYYIWAFDNVTDRKPVVKIGDDLMSFYWENRVQMQEVGEDGLPLERPFIFGSRRRYTQKEGEPEERVNNKWTIGNDPYDATLLETSSVIAWSWAGTLALNTDDFNYYYGATLDTESIMRVRKYKWVPNGTSQWQQDWGNNGEYIYSVASPPDWYYFPGVVSDYDKTLFAANCDMSGAGDKSELIFIDMSDGHEIRRADLSEWWVRPEDADRDGQLAAGPSDLFYRDGYLFCGAHGSCLNTMINPTEDIDHSTIWVNGNGDITGDHNYEEDAQNPWVCHDYNVGPYKYTFIADDQLFSLFPSFNFDALSFGLYAPDGTGLGYHAYSGETATQKLAMHCVSYGSIYDGMYMGKATRADFIGDPGWFYCGMDAIKGTITASDIIMVKSPTGGETWSASAIHEIKWTSMGIETVRIEYSSDGGQSWAMIADDVVANSSPYAWTIPDDISDNCIVRISDTTGAVEPDTSDQFSIVAPYITITAPVPGNVLETGIETEITWLSDGVRSVALTLSLDGGISWDIIDDNITASEGSYRWIPESLTETGKIRLTSTDDSSLFSESNGYFQIAEAFIVVDQPAGNETYLGGDVLAIQWRSSSSINTVDIVYSIDNGESWHVIAEEVTRPDNTYNWTMPNETSENCYIRVVSSVNSSIAGVNASPFSIEKNLELWQVYNVSNSPVSDLVRMIAVDSKGGVWFATRFGGGAVYFYGNEWTVFTTSNSSMESDDLTAVVVDQNDVAWFGSGMGHLMSYDGTEWHTYYDSPIRIHNIAVDNNNNLWLATNENGLAYYNKSTFTVYTTANSSMVNNLPVGLAVDSENALWIGYYSDRGVHRFDGINWEYYSQPRGVTAISIDNSNNVWFSSSNSDTGAWRYDGENMTSYPASNLVGPRVWASAVDYNDVVWFAGTGGITSYDGIQWKHYTTDNSEIPHFDTLAVAVGNDNTMWFGTMGGGAVSYTRVTGPYARVVMPNGGEIWATDETREIRWQSLEIDAVDIAYSSDNGQSWVTIANGVEAEKGTYPWQTPSESSTGYLVRITDSEDGSLSDTTNGTFTITDPFIRITSPNGGEQWAADSEYTVRWVSLGVNTGTLSFSPDAGETWSVVNTGVNLQTGSYVWRTPGIISGTCLLRLNDNLDTGILDMSDEQFSLTPPYITVIYPNGGEELETSDRIGIIWESHGYSSVDISFSVDGGESWNELTTDFNASIGKYDWDPPNVTTRLCLVKVSAASEPDTYDTSDGVFDLINNVITDVDEIMPETFSVRQNYPNPFNPSTTITYSLPDGDYTRIEVFDVTGRIVETLVDEWRNAGRHSIVWDASGQAAGLYFCRVVSGANSEVMKMMLVK